MFQIAYLTYNKALRPLRSSLSVFAVPFILFLLIFSCTEKNTSSTHSTPKAQNQNPNPTLPYYNTPDFTPIFLQPSENPAEKITHTIASFTLTNQHGQEITRATIEDDIHVANFIFTSCAVVCPIMTKHMKKIEQVFTKDSGVSLLSFSVTPWIDSVARLSAYAKRQNITSPNWHLLTGLKGEIYSLARQSYFAEEDIGFTRDSTEFLHTEHFILVDQDQRIRGIYNGTLELEIDQLIADIHSLKKE